MSDRELIPGLVAIPAVGTMPTPAVSALLGLAVPTGTRFALVEGGHTVALKRKLLARELLRDTELQFLLYLDSDMTPPPHALSQLLSHNVDVVGALCFARVAPHRACVWPRENDETDLGQRAGLRRVDGIGAGCLLVRRNVFERMPEPWFTDTEAPDTRGEDKTFCLHLRAAGIPVHVDLDLVVPHLGTIAIDRDVVRAHGGQMLTMGSL